MRLAPVLDEARTWRHERWTVLGLAALDGIRVDIRTGALRGTWSGGEMAIGVPCPLCGGDRWRPMPLVALTYRLWCACQGHWSRAQFSLDCDLEEWFVMEIAGEWRPGDGTFPYRWHVRRPMPVEGKED